MRVPLSFIRELDEPFWFGHDDVPTCRAIAEHARLIEATDLSYPIILSSDGRVMDGMHRVCKAVLLGHLAITAVRFTTDPAPDYTDVHPNELPYDELLTPHNQELYRTATGGWFSRVFCALLRR